MEWSCVCVCVLGIICFFLFFSIPGIKPNDLTTLQKWCAIRAVSSALEWLRGSIRASTCYCRLFMVAFNCSDQIKTVTNIQIKQEHFMLSQLFLCSWKANAIKIGSVKRAIRHWKLKKRKNTSWLVTPLVLGNSHAWSRQNVNSELSRTQCQRCGFS